MELIDIGNTVVDLHLEGIMFADDALAIWTMMHGGLGFIDAEGNEATSTPKSHENQDHTCYPSHGAHSVIHHRSDLKPRRIVDTFCNSFFLLHLFERNFQLSRPNMT